MKVKAKEREFSIYDLFCHDHEATSVSPFSDWDVAQALNIKAQDLYPERYVFFVCPSDSSLSQWNVRFSADRYDYDDNNDVKYETYPMPRVYDERAFRKLIPVELDEVLMELNNTVVEL